MTPCAIVNGSFEPFWDIWIAYAKRCFCCAHMGNHTQMLTGGIQSWPPEQSKCQFTSQNEWRIQQSGYGRLAEAEPHQAVKGT